MIEQQEWHGLPVYTMKNDKLSASLCPELGNNLYRLYDSILRREVLRTPAHPDQIREQAVHYGTPMMMPPNRIRKGEFTFRDRAYRFDVTQKHHGNHIHGVMKNLPWQVKSLHDEAGVSTITCTFETAEFPDVQRQYPHDLLMEMTYELKDTVLKQSLKVLNRGSEAAPFGFGLHTWFMLDGQPENWTLKVPLSGLWELDQENIPTGSLLPLGQYEPIIRSINLQGLDLDTVFQTGGHPNTALLSRQDCQIEYSTSDAYKQWVIYTKGQADEFICLEPYTWVTNAPNLNLPNELTGFRAIEAGGTVQLEVILTIRHK